MLAQSSLARHPPEASLHGLRFRVAVWTKGHQTVRKLMSREAMAEAPALISLLGNPPPFSETQFSELYAAATPQAKSPQRCFAKYKLNLLLTSGGLQPPNPPAWRLPFTGLRREEATLSLMLWALLPHGALHPLGEAHRERQNSGGQGQLYIRTLRALQLRCRAPIPKPLNWNLWGGRRRPYLSY